MDGSRRFWCKKGTLGVCEIPDVNNRLVDTCLIGNGRISELIATHSPRAQEVILEDVPQYHSTQKVILPILAIPKAFSDFSKSWYMYILVSVFLYVYNCTYILSLSSIIIIHVHIHNARLCFVASCLFPGSPKSQIQLLPATRKSWHQRRCQKHAARHREHTWLCLGNIDAEWFDITGSSLIGLRLFVPCFG